MPQRRDRFGKHPGAGILQKTEIRTLPFDAGFAGAGSSRGIPSEKGASGTPAPSMVSKCVGFSQRSVPRCSLLGRFFKLWGAARSDLSAKFSSLVFPSRKVSRDLWHFLHIGKPRTHEIDAKMRVRGLRGNGDDFFLAAIRTRGWPLASCVGQKLVVDAFDGTNITHIKGAFIGDDVGPTNRFGMYLFPSPR